MVYCTFYRVGVLLIVYFSSGNKNKMQIKKMFKKIKYIFSLWKPELMDWQKKLINKCLHYIK